MQKLFVKTMLAAVAVGACASCAQHYQLAGVDRARILIDSRYDARPDAAAARFLAPFKARVDSLMSPVVGRTAHYMAKDRPEGELSDLMPDILMWASPKFNEKPDFAVYNIGGIRAALPEGDITVGDVLDVAPFENKIYFLTLTGDKVKELFAQMAARGGECVSHGVRLRISRDGKLLSATIGGKPVDDGRKYRIVTLDYVAQGNDGMVAFKAKTDVVDPGTEQNNVRYLVMDYFRSMAAQGKAVSSRVEGRIVVE